MGVSSKFIVVALALAANAASAQSQSPTAQDNNPNTIETTKVAGVFGKPANAATVQLGRVQEGGSIELKVTPAIPNFDDNKRGMEAINCPQVIEIAEATTFPAFNSIFNEFLNNTSHGKVFSVYQNGKKPSATDLADQVTALNAATMLAIYKAAAACADAGQKSDTPEEVKKFWKEGLKAPSPK